MKTLAFKPEALLNTVHCTLNTWQQLRTAGAVLLLLLVLASGLGMLPIAISTGIGSENRVGIGIASVGGIIVAGIGTLTILPLVYTLTTRRGKDKVDGSSAQEDLTTEYTDKSQMQT